MEQETEVSIERPVVSAFLKVELGSFKVTMKTDCADLCTEDSRVNTKVLCSVGKFACERHQDFNLGSDGGFLKPAQRKHGQEGRIHFERLVSWCGRTQLSPVYIEDNIFNFELSKEMKSTENNIVNNSPQPSNESGKAMRS